MCQLKKKKCNPLLKIILFVIAQYLFILSSLNNLFRRKIARKHRDCLNLKSLALLVIYALAIKNVEIN